eukprot:ANDGO_02653.mRNA.1 Exopolysaccharide phosphotransferase SCO2594
MLLDDRFSRFSSFGRLKPWVRYVAFMCVVVMLFQMSGKSSNMSESIRSASSFSMCRKNCDRVFSDNIAGKSFESELCSPEIDIVYTWVNGKDPRQTALLRYWKEKEGLESPVQSSVSLAESAQLSSRNADAAKSAARDLVPLLQNSTVVAVNDSVVCQLITGSNNSTSEDEHAGTGSSYSHQENDDVTSTSRFRDNDELLYSLRSVEKYAPWVRRIYIVTNGQVPAWLNTDHPKIRIVSHEEIFVNKSHLPTFSSPSIEAHLHRIPGLSKKFLYLNDDIMFGSEVWPEDFYTATRGQKVFLSWSVPNCADSCPDSWLGDGYCDRACNVSACDFDAGDCLKPGAVASSGLSNGTGSSSTFWNSWSSSTVSDRQKRQCAPGCPDTWLNDKFCDSACKSMACGYDASDCGLDIMESHMDFGSITSTDVAQLAVNESLSFVVSPGHLSFFVRLNETFSSENTLKSASHDNSALIRTASLSLKHKVLTLTFHRNVSGSAKVVVAVDSGTAVEFYITADTSVPPPPEPTLGPSTPTVSSSSAANRYAPPAPTVGGATAWSTPIVKTAHQSREEQALDDRKLTDEEVRLKHMMIAFFQSRQHSAVAVDDAFVETNVTSILQDFQSFVSSAASSRTRASAGLRPNVTESSSLSREEATGVFDNVTIPVVDGDNSTLTNTDIEERSSLSRKLLDLELMNEDPGSFSTVPQDIVLSSLASELLFDPEFMSTARTLLLDSFGSSLRHVQRLYNKAYGTTTRKVPAHMPHLIDKEIMESLQKKYPVQFDETSSHRFRSTRDMQYSFSYFYFLMEEKEDIDARKMFNEYFDTNHDSVLSWNELRTLAVFLSKIDDFEPLAEKSRIEANTSATIAVVQTHDSSEILNSSSVAATSTSTAAGLAAMSAIAAASRTGSFKYRSASREKTLTDHFMDELVQLIQACGRNANVTRLSVNSSSVELVSNALKSASSIVKFPKRQRDVFASCNSTARDCALTFEAVIENCEPIRSTLVSYFQTMDPNAGHKYRHEVMALDDVAFEMLGSNDSSVLRQLDSVRRRRSKFICLNDNMSEESPSVQRILREFYESFFPLASSFELPWGSFDSDIPRYVKGMKLDDPPRSEKDVAQNKETAADLHYHWNVPYQFWISLFASLGMMALLFGFMWYAQKKSGVRSWFAKRHHKAYSSGSDDGSQSSQQVFPADGDAAVRKRKGANV